mgnify:CR=1 FL=1
MGAPWTVDDISRLTHMVVVERLSAGVIAQELGEGFTRNSVIGKINRQRARGLLPASKPRAAKPPRMAPRLRRRNGERKAYQAKAVVRLERTPVPRPVAAPTSAPVTLLAIGPGQCRYIVDEQTRGPATLMCAAPTHDGSPWCEFHIEHVWQHRLHGIPPRRDMRRDG